MSHLCVYTALHSVQMCTSIIVCITQIMIQLGVNLMGTKPILSLIKTDQQIEVDTVFCALCIYDVAAGVLVGWGGRMRWGRRVEFDDIINCHIASNINTF